MNEMQPPLEVRCIRNCWPKTLEIGSMKAGDQSVLTEKLTIVFEELTVEAG